MAEVVFKGLFFQNARGLTLDDTASLVWSFDPQTNTLTGTATGSGVDEDSLKSYAFFIGG